MAYLEPAIESTKGDSFITDPQVSRWVIVCPAGIQNSRPENNESAMNLLMEDK
jgi:hypothetical protein